MPHEANPYTSLGILMGQGGEDAVRPELLWYFSPVIPNKPCS